MRFPLALPLTSSRLLARGRPPDGSVAARIVTVPGALSPENGADFARLCCGPRPISSDRGGPTRGQDGEYCSNRISALDDVRDFAMAGITPSSSGTGGVLI